MKENKCGWNVSDVCSKLRLVGLEYDFDLEGIE